MTHQEKTKKTKHEQLNTNEEDVVINDANVKTKNKKNDPKKLIKKKETDLELYIMPLATHPNPRLHIHDVNDTILYFESTQRPPTTPIYPDNMVEKLLTFFSETYCVGHTDLLINTFKEEVKKVMIRFHTYFIMDLITDPKVGYATYNIIAALILEEHVLLNRIDYSVIHMLSVRDGWEQKKHIMVLLLHVLRTTTIDNRPMIFIYQFGKYRFQYPYRDENADDDNFYVNPEHIFTQMRFVEYEYECFDELILPQSRYLYANGHNIFSACQNVELRNGTYRLCYTHNYVKKMCRYSKEKGHFELYSHPFKWTDANQTDVQYISKSIQKYCKKTRTK